MVARARRGRKATLSEKLLKHDGNPHVAISRSLSEEVEFKEQSPSPGGRPRTRKARALEADGRPSFPEQLEAVNVVVLRRMEHAPHRERLVRERVVDPVALHEDAAILPSQLIV